MTNTLNPYAAAFALGAVCGARTFLGPALLAETAPPAARFAVRALSLGEIVGDKMPFTPSRLLPGGLSARFVTGAVCGAIVCHRAGQSPVAGALLGAAGALLWAKTGHDLRVFLGNRLSVPDPIVALGEDSLAAWAGRLAAA